MAELREETGVQRSLTERLVRSRLQWAGHVDRMEGDRQPKRAAELREKRKANAEMGGLNTGEKGDMKKKTGDRGGWETLADEAVEKLQAAPHP